MSRWVMRMFAWLGFLLGRETHQPRQSQSGLPGWSYGSGEQQPLSNPKQLALEVSDRLDLDRHGEQPAHVLLDPDTDQLDSSRSGLGDNLSGTVPVIWFSIGQGDKHLALLATCHEISRSEPEGTRHGCAAPSRLHESARTAAYTLSMGEDPGDSIVLTMAARERRDGP